MRSFYKATWDPAISNEGWGLRFSGPESEDPERDFWVFADAKRLSVAEPLAVEVRYPGIELDYHLITYHGTPVVAEHLVEPLSRLAGDELQFIPTTLVGSKVGRVFIMNVTTALDAIDYSSSEVKIDDGDPLSHAGIRHLVVDREMAGSAHVFRLRRYLPIIVVSEEFRQAFADCGARGCLFRPV